ncbi:hypothetical protein RSAG8_05142, partial [Rhizoctonia solani AG-8 WAC10335]
MEVAHSKWYYFSKGDVVIQVESRLYKLHQDILETYSGFFKDMLSSHSSDGSEGMTDDNPLSLPQELCTSIYPSRLRYVGLCIQSKTPLYSESTPWVKSY